MKTPFRLILFLFVFCAGASAGPSTDRKVFTDAIANTCIGGPPHRAGTVIRQELTGAELAAGQSVNFALKLRNYEELQSRIRKGDVISMGEMQATFLPTQETWAKVAAWARAQGMAVRDEDASRMTVFASSSVTRVESALQMRFARVVGTDGREYTSAITPPSIPAGLADCVIGIRKLQPHLRPVHSQTITPIAPATGCISPTTIAQLYNASGLGLSGAGQTIVVRGETHVNPGDLTAFWKACGLPTTAAQFVEIDPHGTPSSADLEETMDLEWASAMAPGATVVYFSSIDAEDLESWLFSQTTYPSIHQATTSYFWDPGVVLPDSQYYAAMTAVGVTFFGCSGDYGSTGGAESDSSTIPYDPSGTTAPSYPSSDPFVTGVGGTCVVFTKNAAGGPALPVTECGWCLPNGQPLSADAGSLASTGGISGSIPRPLWQTGLGVPSGTMRCVPDVAALAAGNFPGFVLFQGSAYAAGGTSMSAPIWSGLCALVNQARANAGLGPVGLLGPKIYPLSGTSSFNQMTTGSAKGTDGFSSTAGNGAYTVGANYNLVTGLGSPNLGSLVAALTTPTTGVAPVVTTQPMSQTVSQGGTATFTVAASGNPAPSYQWTINGAVVLDGLQPDYSTASGATTDTLTISNAQDTTPIVAIATNSNGMATSNPVTLEVNLPSPPIALVTTLAGSGNTGSTDGQGTGIQASFDEPSGVAVDGSGNVYVADTVNCKIRKTSPSGIVTTLAGNGDYGALDGAGTAASFWTPYGVAVDASGNVYVADSGNQRIRKVSPSGAVTTLAGSGEYGSMDGMGTAASFLNPTGVAVDAAGNVFVADSGNNKIRKVNPAGVVVTLAGHTNSGANDGTGTGASFFDPTGVAVDAAGDVFVADSGNNEIRKISPSGVVTTLAGHTSSGANDGTGTGASFSSPTGVAVDAAGNVFVADSFNSKVREVSSAGVVTTLAGSGKYGLVDGMGTAASFERPAGVAVDASGSIFVGDSAANEIRRVSATGVVKTWAGGVIAGSVDGSGVVAAFNAPGDVAVDASGNVYVADCSNNTIRKVSPAGFVTTLAGSASPGSANGTGTTASFNNPTGLAVDASGNIYVTDTNNNMIRKIDPAGVVTTLAGSGSAGSADDTGTRASFNWPTGPAVDAAGNVYVADQGNNKIRKVSPAGVVTTLAGSGSQGWADGAGTEASFYGPAGVAVDSSGNVYEADAGNCEIRKISPTGMVSTLAGNPNYGGWTDGSGAYASFNGPAGVALDVFGNVYVADSGNNTIRKVSPAGMVITLAGGSNSGAGDGSGTAASFNNPQGVGADPAGVVYVADYGNNKIRKITQTARAVPVITWAAPAAVNYGTALSSAQLNATANVPGTFVYAPAAGAVLPAGAQMLSVTFTPTDSTSYTPVSALQTLTVILADYPAFLQQIYPLVLGRQIDPGALSAYEAAMSGGLTRANVYRDLINSPEFVAWQVEPVIRLYYAAFARMPDYAGLQNWSNALHAGALTLDQAADQFVASPEFQQTYGSLTDTQFVTLLYANVLGRAPDQAGLQDWVDLLAGGASRGTVLVGFSESDEFKADMANQVAIIRLYYLLLQRMPTATELQSWLAFLQGDDETDTLFAQGYPAGLDSSDYVQLVFQGFLRRNADSGALGAFGGALDAGTLTHGGLVDTLLSSGEFSQYVGPVSRLYLSAFRRVPDAPGLDNWVNYMRAGNTLESVADAFVASPEFQLTYGSLDDTQYVTLLYQNVLGRAPDPAGLQDWVNLLGSGSTRGQVLIGFSESQEAIHLFAPILRTFLTYYAFLDTAPTGQDLSYWTTYLTTLNDQFCETLLDELAVGS